MKKLIAISILVASLGIAFSEPLKTVYNPFTGKSDYITKIDSNTIQPGSNITVTNISTGGVIISATAGGGSGVVVPSTFTWGPIIVDSQTIVTEMNFNGSPFLNGVPMYAGASVDHDYCSSFGYNGINLGGSSGCAGASPSLTLDAGTSGGKVNVLPESATFGSLGKFYWYSGRNQTGTLDLAVQRESSGILGIISDVTTHRSGIKLYGSVNNANFVILQATATSLSNSTYTLPSSIGSAGQYLKLNNTGGDLAWDTPPGDNLGNGTGSYGVATTTGGFTGNVSVGDTLSVTKGIGTSTLSVTGASGASVTYGMTVGSITVTTTMTVAGVEMTGTGNPSYQTIDDPSWYQIIGSSTAPTVGQLLIASSSHTAIGLTNLSVSYLNGGTGATSSTFFRGDGTWVSSSTFGGGSPAGPAWSVQSSSGGALGGWANFTNNGTTITVTDVNTKIETNVSTVTVAGVYYDLTTSSMVVGGYFQLPSRTLAQLQALSPAKVGLEYYCSDCVSMVVCYSTGTTAYAVASSSKTRCQ